MIIITSISPQHPVNQLEATMTWQKAKCAIYSFNTEAEINSISHLYPHITFIKVSKDAHSLFGRPVPYLYEMVTLAAGLTEDLICIMNSDIYLEKHDDIWRRIMHLSNNGLVITRKYNVEGAIAKEEKFGIDFFMFHKRFVHLLIDANLAMGMPFWDYWIPYAFAINETPVYNVKSRITYHRVHINRWNSQNWLLAAKLIRQVYYISEPNIKLTSYAMRKVFERKAKRLKFNNDHKIKKNPHEHRRIRKVLYERRPVA